mgnify:CR=1 FL=1
MFGAHKEEYTIDGKRYTVVANFMAESMTVHGQGISSFTVPMKEYTDFEGNCEDWLTHILKERNL